MLSRMISSVFALLGLLVALYLWLYHLGLSPLVCPISGCEKVQASQYSSILGIPVATIGFFAFAALLIANLVGVLSERVDLDRFVFGVSSLGLLAYSWFTYLELFVIRAICFWCVVSSVMMLGVWLFSLLAIRGRQVQASDQRPAQPLPEVPRAH
jgi:uncharacterized membrane protein